MDKEHLTLTYIIHVSRSLSDCPLATKTRHDNHYLVHKCELVNTQLLQEKKKATKLSTFQMHDILTIPAKSGKVSINCIAGIPQERGRERERPSVVLFAKRKGIRVLSLSQGFHCWKRSRQILTLVHWFGPIWLTICSAAGPLCRRSIGSHHPTWHCIQPALFPARLLLLEALLPRAQAPTSTWWLIPVKVCKSNLVTWINHCGGLSHLEQEMHILGWAINFQTSAKLIILQQKTVQVWVQHEHGEFASHRTANGSWATALRQLVTATTRQDTLQDWWQTWKLLTSTRQFYVGAQFWSVTIERVGFSGVHAIIVRWSCSKHLHMRRQSRCHGPHHLLAESLISPIYWQLIGSLAVWGWNPYSSNEQEMNEINTSYCLA